MHRYSFFPKTDSVLKFLLIRSSHEGRRKTSEKLSRTWQRYCCPFWHHKCGDSSPEADFPHFWGVRYRKTLLQQHPDDVNFAQHGTFKANRLEAAPGMEKTITKCTSLNRVWSAASVRRPSHGQCHLHWFCEWKVISCTLLGHSSAWHLQPNAKTIINKVNK